MLQSKDTEWLNGYKNKTHICYPQQTYFRCKDTQTESEGMDKGFIMQTEKKRKLV